MSILLAMLHPELLDPDDIEAISHDGPRLDHAEAASKLPRSRPKSPITLRSRPGFVVNSILLPMINEAFFALAEGDASATEIDEGMKPGRNHPIGPLALTDLIGLEVLLAIMQTIHDEFGDSKYRPCPALREMVAAGYPGREARRGVYWY
jgi:3-hydroxybutyryl-CoA dehydrogenase